MSSNEQEWLPIETAPRDGTEIIGWGKHLGYAVVRYDVHQSNPEFPWLTSDQQYSAAYVTHWRHLPERPGALNPTSKEP
jgi:hypothetical protein